MKTALPVKVAGLELNEAASGFVVFDSSRDRIHYLNHTATLILELCTGDLSATDIADALQEAYALPESPITEVEATLDRLRTEGLVV